MSTREFSRLDRLSSTIRKCLAEPISALARTRDAGLVSITAVELSPDLRHGTIYLSVYGADALDFVRHLGERAPMLQAVLAQALRTKRVPVLHFRLDDTLERAERINSLLHGTSVKDAEP